MTDASSENMLPIREPEPERNTAELPTAVEVPMAAEHPAAVGTPSIRSATTGRTGGQNSRHETATTSPSGGIELGEPSVTAASGTRLYNPGRTLPPKHWRQTRQAVNNRAHIQG